MTRAIPSWRVPASLLATAMLSANAGCGYNEGELQAQLAKAQNLRRQIADEKKQIEKLEAELAKRRGKKQP